MRRIILTTIGSIGTLWCLYVGFAFDSIGFIGAAVFGATTLAVFMTPQVPARAREQQPEPAAAGQGEADSRVRRGSSKRRRNR